MRMKIIKRFSAATVGVCFTYALVRLPFTMINNPGDSAVEWTTSTSTVSTEVQSSTRPSTQPTTRVQATQGTTQYDITEPTTLPVEQETTVPATEAITEQYTTEEIITNDYSPESDDENEYVFEQNETSGDVPTLEQFLRNMSCGGCRHNCLLVNPRCMKGRAKAESATVEYYETYGA